MSTATAHDMPLDTRTPRTSRHAEVRSRQRGIPPLILDWLVRYGNREHDGHGAEVHFFDRAARRRLGQVAGDAALGRLGDLLDAYAVVSADGAVVTVGHRYRRIRRR